jgi:uncharacterized phage protein gp47/JayE
VALTTPEDVAEVIDRAIADVELALAEFGGKPSLSNSWLKALIVALSNRVFDFYYALDVAALEALPDTAVENLDRWAAIWGVTRTPGAPSNGNAVAVGVLGSVVQGGAIVAAGDGKQYRVDVDSEVTAKSLSVASITRVGQVATLTTTSPHGLGTNVRISVVGAAQSEYNVVDVFVLSIASPTVITYAVAGAPATPATGTILLEFDSAVLALESVEPGSAQDQPFDSALKLESPIAGVDDVVRVDFDELGGGADRELDAALRERLLERIQNPIAHFNVAEITAVAKSIPGVTRVFVQEITPQVGQVTIYFTRDNDDDPIPNGAEVAAVEAVIQAIRPANSDEDDVFVFAPTPVTVNFTFTALSPNTASMKTAIEANLRQLFEERTSVGVSVIQDAYRSAIFNTVDVETGDEVESFTLTAPSGTIVVAAGQIAVMGNVVFP